MEKAEKVEKKTCFDFIWSWSELVVSLFPQPFKITLKFTSIFEAFNFISQKVTHVVQPVHPYIYVKLSKQFFK